MRSSDTARALMEVWSLKSREGVRTAGYWVQEGFRGNVRGCCVGLIVQQGLQKALRVCAQR